MTGNWQWFGRARRRAVSAVAVTLVASIATGGCSGDADRRVEGGTIAGAVAGGLIGSAVGRGRGGRFAGALVGTVVGGIIGNELARGMNERERRIAAEAELDALERGGDGERRSWRSAESDYRGDIVPGRRYRRGGGECRDYTHTIFIRGREEVLRGTACREPDGTWRAIG
ncbi:MAG: glycine zipper domain-containing protein [Hyphomicrobiaceae bacterium]